MDDSRDSQPDLTDRRYTDREVALILKTAAELEEKRQTSAHGRGLTLRELQEIAREVGISAEVVKEAVSRLPAPGDLRSGSWLGPPSMAKTVRAIPATVSRENLTHLLRIVEERVNDSGTVSEALGTIRWTSVPHSRGITHTTQILFTPGDKETHVQVTERYAPRVRPIFHFIPMSWGAMLGVGIAGSIGLPALAAIALVAAGGAIGAAAGRGVWSVMARRSSKRVEELAGELADQARASAESSGE